MDSITEKRRSSIMEELRRHEVVKVSELSNRFGVSEVSIRRDMRYLEKLGALKRVHGGAISVANQTRWLGRTWPTPTCGPSKNGASAGLPQRWSRRAIG